MAGGALSTLQEQREHAFDARFEQTFGKMDDDSMPAGVNTHCAL